MGEFIRVEVAGEATPQQQLIANCLRLLSMTPGALTLFRWRFVLDAETPKELTLILTAPDARIEHPGAGMAEWSMSEEEALSPLLALPVRTEAEEEVVLARAAALGRAWLRDALLHELDEALLVGGVRFWDPHRGETGHG